MTTYDAGDVTLEKVRDYVWEIPQQGDMRAPARVFASEALLDEIADDKTLEQLRNATHLPGITKYAVCMPDGHQGYGFPVGGVGAMDARNGCISPGAVGYDINCLSGDSEVLLSFGRRARLDSLERRFEDESAAVATGDAVVDSSVRLFTKTESETVHEVETATGERIEATADHPFLTPEGMTDLRNLAAGDTVYVHPFEGIEDETPEEFVVLDDSQFADEDEQVLEYLDDLDLLPLHSTDERFNILLKLVGYHTGDGAFNNDGQTTFYGDPEDLETIQEDIRAAGFTPSSIYSRDRDHEIGEYSFSGTEYSVRCSSRAFAAVVQALGAPEGEKIASGFNTPSYLSRLADWQRALYYAAYFGAEMNTPSAQHDKNLYCPKISQTRTVDTVEDGIRFIRDLGDFLESIGVETNSIERLDSNSNSDYDTVRLRLGIKNDSKNLIRFYSTVGFRYNEAKTREAAVATQYLKTKEREIERRERIENEAVRLADGGTPVREIKGQFDINERFVERSIWGDGREGRPRPGSNFPSYDEFRELVDVRDDGTVATEIKSIEKKGQKPVYDIGVEHAEHNFLADGFVVSNCGVRMMTTNLTYADVQGREQELVEALFENVPSGLGGGGVFEGTVGDVEAILEDGVEWALRNDWAVPADLEHCEDEGRRPDADPAAISQKAKERGKSQVGSLGSGNHFLEVQRVTDVYDDDVADAFGLAEDQVVVLIHCGSRGLGHQTCNDYLRRIEQTHAGLLDSLPDRELAAAPAGSQLAEEYYGAMCAAINFAWVNRQLVMHRTRQVFERVFDRDWRDMEMELLYDVAHNIAKKERHQVGVDADGEVVTDDEDAVEYETRELYVHRKGATRAFPAGRDEVPPAYRAVGQPVIIPGSMGTGSYVLRGGERSMHETFGSTAHGAGRLMSRTQAKNEFWGGDVQTDLRERNQIYVKAQSGATVAEEAPGVYKDVDEVVRVSDALGIGDRVARTFPVCNIKG